MSPGAKEWDTARVYAEFFTATGQAVANVFTTTFSSIGQLFYSPVSKYMPSFLPLTSAGPGHRQHILGHP
jgi:hypothetical protein